MEVMDKRKYFLKIFKAAEKKYGKTKRRLAAEGWREPWQTLIATIMSAQSRDKTTIKIAKSLFQHYNTLEKLANANYKDVLRIFKQLNYNKTKARNVIAAARKILHDFNGRIPNSMEKLLEIPGVGRKVANIVLLEVYKRPVIAVDTHIHRLANVLGLVKTKTPERTEMELMKIVPKKYRAAINRVFVTWGQHVPGRDKNKLLKSIGLKNNLKE
jgi:endonuclease-3